MVSGSKMFWSNPKTYGFKKFNAVAHSMGNLTLAYYMLDNGQNKNCPNCKKQVNLAGHYNGIIGLDDQAGQMQLEEKWCPQTDECNLSRAIETRRQLP